MMPRYLSDEAYLRSLSLSERVALPAGLDGSLLDTGSVTRWDRTLAEIFNVSRLSNGPGHRTALTARELRPNESFLSLIQPIAGHAADRLLSEMLAGQHPAIKTLVELELLIDDFREQLHSTLHRIVERTLVLELNVARLSGKLSGETGTERFYSFVESLRDPGSVKRLWEEYPVLARGLVITAYNFRQALETLLAHFAADHDEITDGLFGRRDKGKIVKVEMQAGDSHRRGRTVAIVTCSSGARLVYKPRPLGVDVHFYELIHWLNDKQPEIELKSLRVLDRADHGWVEFVEHQDCSRAEQIHGFYERQGALIAVLYALGATDIHRENLLAAGEHPVAVDLESLFHPRLPRQLFAASLPAEAFVDVLDRSVLATGLLPAPLTADRLDLSGLAGRNGQLTPHRVLQWRDPGSDEWRYARDHVRLSPTNHTPRLKGEPVDVAGFIPEIVSGFQRCYRLMACYRDDLLGGDLLSRFRHDKIRVILRSTQTYGVLLQESYHPDVLRDALDRDRLFDELWAPADKETHLAAVVDAEQEDLRHNDVPIFSTTPGSRDIWTSTNERIPELLAEPSLQTVERCIRNLGQDDLAKQTWLIEASLQCDSAHVRTQGEAAPSAAISGAVNENDTSPDDLRRRLLEGAIQVGDRLTELSIGGEGSSFWLTVGRVDSTRWRIEPCGMDLYDGLPGIALFLAYLGVVSGDEHFTALSRSTVQTMLNKDKSDALTGVGLFTGIGGIVYGLTHLALLWDDEQLLAAAQKHAGRLLPLVDADEDLDILDGSAGCIVGLMPLYSATGSPRLLDILVRCGNRLVDRVVPQEQGHGWRIRLIPERSLAGLAHGAAGIAWALLELWAVTGFDKFRDAALGGIEYERSLFSAAHGNWRDLRDDRKHDMVDGGNSKFMASWCHGAPGIGMARIPILQKLSLAGVLDEIGVALRTTQARGFGGNHCLCHGDLGNIDLLLHARDKLGATKLATEIDSLSADLAAGISGKRQCGIPLPIETPGLMLGLAGIGFGLLRLVDSKEVPSVLLAEAPPVLPPGRGVYE